MVDGRGHIRAHYSWARGDRAGRDPPPADFGPAGGIVLLLLLLLKNHEQEDPAASANSVKTASGARTV